MAAFEHVQRLAEVHDRLTVSELKPGFVFGGERIPLVNPQRGIFKPHEPKASPAWPLVGGAGLAATGISQRRL